MQKVGDSKSKFDLLIRLLLLAWIITKLISLKLWMGDRYFPLVPVSDSLLALPSWIHLALFASSMALMLLSVFKPVKTFIWLISVFELASCLLDQNRWQPWEYQFLFFITSYAALNKEEDRSTAWLIILVSTYFFAGFFKINTAFIHDIWQHLILIKWLHFAPGNVWVLRFGYLLPLVELGAAMMLLFHRLQKVGALTIIGMHLFIILLMGPLGIDGNAGIWPWNIFLATTVYFFFVKDRCPVLLFKSPFHPMLFFLLLIWWIMPWFQALGAWDKYLSSVLYSGGVEQLFICTRNDEALSKASAYKVDKISSVPCSPVIPVYKWGIHEMNTAPNPEPRVIRKVIEYWNKNYGEARFYLFKPGFKATIKIWDADKQGWTEVN